MKVILVALAVLVSTGPARADSAQIRRFAIVIGANDGGAARTKLRYAGSDASSVAKVLGELGGVATADTWTLRDPQPSDINRAFAEAQVQILEARRQGQRAELLVYYSGHSDESGLLLGGQRYGYRDLRTTISQMPSDVKIAVLDSCSSGAFTRTKGGTRRPPFLADQSTEVRGYAFLASSSVDEAAQESDKIAASFFTHFFVSGLRGAADSNRDQRVTLAEAYRFAFDETVQRTETSQAGPQHPAYDMHLVGTGDVVMTDLRATSAQLELAPGLGGRIFVRDRDGRLVVELSKSRGRPVTLGLAPGRFVVTWIEGELLAQATVNLTQGQTARLTRGSFKAVQPEKTVTRGAPPPEGESTSEAIRFSVVPPLTTSSSLESDAYVSINMLVGIGGGVDGLEVGGLVNIDRKDMRGVQVSGIANAVRGDVRGAQLSGLANLNGRSFRGVQLGGIVNSTAGRAEGIQLGGIANVNGGDFDGVQIGGVANINGGATRGVQLGLVNIGGSTSGAQVGLVNIATKAKGLQLGLVNVAQEHEGAPIGLVNWVSNGRHDIEAWTSDTAFAHVGVKLGSRRVYGVLALAVSDDAYHMGSGLGVHFPIGAGYIDVDAVYYDLMTHDFDDSEINGLTKLRLAYGYRFAPNLAAFAGIAGNFSTSKLGEGDNPSFLGAKTFEDSDRTYRLSPGFFAGVSY